MDELLVISWEEERLVLRQIPRVGIWSMDTAVQNSVLLEYPDDISKLQDNFYRSKLRDGFSSLLSDISLPEKQVWMLLPPKWVQHFHVDNPGLASDELRSFLLWEAEQQLHGDLSDYHILLPTIFHEQYIEIRAIRSYLLKSILTVADETEFQLIGLGVEPNQDGAYAFQDEENLCNAISMEHQAEPDAESPPKNWKNIIIASISILTMVIVGIYFIKAISDRTIDTKLASIATSTLVPTVTNQDSSQLTENLQTKANPNPQISDNASSPVIQLITALPVGGRISLATLSPIEFKAELTGISNPEGWLNSVKSQGMLINFRLESSKVVVVSTNNSGWKSNSETLSFKNWKQQAINKGLTVNERSASGGQKEILSFVNELWQAPQGIDKIYFASVGEKWVVTVQ